MLGELPRAHCKNYASVRNEVLNNCHPPRPLGPLRHCPNEMSAGENNILSTTVCSWLLMEKCWHTAPVSRPSMANARAELFVNIAGAKPEYLEACPETLLYDVPMLIDQ